MDRENVKEAADALTETMSKKGRLCGHSKRDNS